VGWQLPTARAWTRSCRYRSRAVEGRRAGRPPPPAWTVTLLAVEGPTPSVCWAAELVSVRGVGDDGLIAVLLAVISCAQTAQVELTASSLAAALDDR